MEQKPGWMPQPKINGTGVVRKKDGTISKPQAEQPKEKAHGSNPQ